MYFYFFLFYAAYGQNNLMMSIMLARTTSILGAGFVAAVSGYWVQRRLPWLTPNLASSRN